MKTNVNIHLHRTLNLTITVAPIQLWKWQMYISQNLRQSWYGNLLGEEENDDDQDAMKVNKIESINDMSTVDCSSSSYLILACDGRNKSVSTWNNDCSINYSYNFRNLSIQEWYVYVLSVFDIELPKKKREKKNRIRGSTPTPSILSRSVDFSTSL
jgi:hypothetical protein